MAGGLGTRLREETEFKPKPMVQIGGKPILWHIMKTYSHYGFRDFVICLGYKGEMIKEYFFNYEYLNNDFQIELGDSNKVKTLTGHDEKGWKVILSDTGPRTLKGGRIKRIEKYIKGDTFMATYGDGLANIDISALLDFHKKHGKLATLTGITINPTSRFGELKTDGERVESFKEKPTTVSNLINGGYFVFNRKIFDYLRPDEDCDLEVGALEEIAHQNQLMVYRHPGFWTCMDTIADMGRINQLWDEDKVEWKVW